MLIRNRITQIRSRYTAVPERYSPGQLWESTLVLVWSSNESWENSHVNSRFSTLMQLSCQLNLGQTRTRVACELTSESLHESFLNFHCLIKREQELHESWQARVYMRVFSTFIARSNENKSCMRVDKREFLWEFSQLSLLDQTRTRVAWELTWEFSQLSLLDQTRTRVAWELTSESWQARVFSTFIAWSNENKSCTRVDKREFTWEFSQLSLLDQTRTRVACMRVDKRE
jgi:hypothetical protein